MKSRFITDPHDPFDSFDSLLDPAEAEIYANFFPHAGNSGGNPPASAPVVPILEIPPTPALTSEAVQAESAQSGATTVVAATSGGITINLLFDAAAMAAPASFRAGIQQAASILTAAISDKITVNIGIDYSGTGGGAAAGPDNGLYESYSSVRADLIDNATAGDAVFNALPSGTSFQGQSNVAVWNAQLKLFGLLGANDTTTDDGSATFATDINSNLLVGVALHELTHAMGRVPYGPPYGPQPDIFDFFRFTSPGTRLIDGGSTAPAAYFSVDGGFTKLAGLGQTSDPSDFLNSGVQGPNDPFNEYYTGSTIQTLTTADKEILDALGFHLGPPPKPDLSEYVAVSNTTVAAGGSVTIDAYAMNLGNGVSGPSTARIYLSTDATIDTSDTVLATLNSGTLATVSQPGYYDHQTVSVTLPGNLAPGTYYIGGIANYNNAVSESNTTNHTYDIVQITVPAATARPAASAADTSVNGLLAGSAGGDTFVFAPNFGNATITNFRPALDHIQIDHTVFATVAALLANTHDDAHVNAVIDAGTNHTITVQDVTTDTLQHHLNDFHIV
jgi:CARDB